MLSWTIAWLAGILLLYSLSDLPAPILLLLCWLPGFMLLLLPALRGYARLPLLFAAGFSWAALSAWSHLTPSLDPSLEGKPLQISGTIDSLPQREGRILRFVLALDGDDSPHLLPKRVRLAWYERSPELLPGERWQLQVKLKRTWSLRNPGSFDYEEWLFQQGIRATGYVIDSGANRRLQEANGYPVARLRYALRQAIDQALGDDPMVGIVTALAIGERGAISDEQWDVLLASGTNHLVAISGLHIGLVAGLVYLLLLRLWRFCPRCCEWLPAPRAAALMAMLAAVAYAALAGFSIPTQRALVMLAVVLGAVWWRRPIERGRVLLLALWAVLLLDPAAILSAGFWLSFAAVAWILYGMGGRPNAAGLWWRWGRVQLLVALGLMPFLLLFFQQGSLSSPLANLIAVPWVSLLVVPLVLIGVLLLGLWPAAAGLLLQLAATLLGWLWPVLQWLAVAIPVLPLAGTLWLVIPALAGLLWLLAPRGWPLRSMGAVLLLPLLLRQPDVPDPGVARLTLLDVGQGLAAVVQTNRHTLLFDTGPSFASGFDTGDAVVVPFLRHSGIGRIDTLVISHGNSDHAGGLDSVLRQIPVSQLIADSEVASGMAGAETCHRGLAWEWDGVSFRFIHPLPDSPTGDPNNHSCVLRVSSGEHALLLSADIESGAERELLTSGEPLQADLLLAPHHGSKSSSSGEFIDAVAPKQVLFSVGYRNRYGFPHPSVVQRYAEHAAALYRTDASGALQVELKPDSISEPLAYRPRFKRLWHGNM